MSKYLRYYELMSGIAMDLVRFGFIENIERYFVPLCQWDDARPYTTVNLFMEPKAISSSKAFEQFARSLQNSGRMHNSIKFDEKERKAEIHGLTNGFDSHFVLEQYASTVSPGCSGPFRLYQSLYKVYRGHGWTDVLFEDDESAASKSNLRKFAQGLYESAVYLNRKDECGRTGLDRINEAVCMQWDTGWNNAMDALPNELQKSGGKQGVFGLCPALARDFLKECGCVWMVKPDTHLRRVANSLGLLDGDSNEGREISTEASLLTRKLVEVAIEIRNETGRKVVTPHRIDKMIWLLCTGSFYHEKEPEVRSYRSLLIRALRNVQE